MVIFNFYPHHVIHGTRQELTTHLDLLERDLSTPWN